MNIRLVKFEDLFYKPTSGGFVRVGQIWKHKYHLHEIEIVSIKIGDPYDIWFKVVSVGMNPHLTVGSRSCCHSYELNTEYDMVHLASGAICSKCGDFYPYANQVFGFRCWACRNGW